MKVWVVLYGSGVELFHYKEDAMNHAKDLLRSHESWSEEDIQERFLDDNQLHNLSTERIDLWLEISEQEVL